MDQALMESCSLIQGPVKCVYCGDDQSVSHNAFMTEYQCMKCYKKESAVRRAALLELAARWYDRIGEEPEPDLAEYMGLK